MTGILVFDVCKAKESRKKIAGGADEIQRVFTKLQSALDSTAWWTGDSKAGFTRRGALLLEAVDTAAKNAFILESDLSEIAKDKEEEERGLKNILEQGGV